MELLSTHNTVPKMKTLQNIAASLSFCYLGTLLVNLRLQPKRKKTGMRKPQGRDKTYHCSAAPHVTTAPRDLGRPSESASKTFGFEHKSAAYTHTHGAGLLTRLLC